MRFLKIMKKNTKKNYQNFSDLKITFTKGFLNQKSPFFFKISPEKRILKIIAKKLEVLKLSNFRCFGEIKRIENNKYKFKCIISCQILQECVISLELMKVYPRCIF